MALFDHLKSGLSRTRQGIQDGLRRIVARRSQIDEELLAEVEELLLSGDVGITTATAILDQVRQRLRQEPAVDASRLQELLREELKALLVGEGGQPTTSSDFFNPAAKPFVLLVVGVNGTGKTTTIGKMAVQFTRRGKKVLIAAADTFRAAAAEQLAIWAERSNSHFIQQQAGADPAAVAYDAGNSAMARELDVVIIDTAGRLHTKVNLMEELKKVRRVITKQVPNAPHETLLVLDATIGQNAKRQVEEFSRAADITGIVLTKLDGTAKGGVVIGIANEFKIPVKFIGIGERIDDLEPFDAGAFVDALFQP